MPPPASFALLVDAKNDQAANFYKHHGFRAAWQFAKRSIFAFGYGGKNIVRLNEMKNDDM